MLLNPNEVSAVSISQMMRDIEAEVALTRHFIGKNALDL